MKKLLLTVVLTAAFFTGLLFAMKVTFHLPGLLQPVEETIAPVPPEDFEETGYYYVRLTDAEKAAYAAIVRQAEDFPEEIEIPPLETEQLGRVVKALSLDHPMLYLYNQGVTLARHDNKYFFAPHYSCTKEEYETTKDRVEQTVQRILAQTPDGSDYDKEVYLHDYMTGHCRYDEKETGADNDNPAGALLNGCAICSGYAKAYKLLLDAVGIENTLLTGKTSEDGGDPVAHIWNAVKLNGAWYYVDVTWDDPIMENDGAGLPLSSHNYFNVTDAMLAPTHSDYEFDYPCDDESLFYYRVNDAYLTGDDDVVRFVADLIAAAGKEGRDYIDFKCESDGVYKAAIKKLFTNEKIYRAINNANLKLSRKFGSRSVQYSVDDANRRIIILFNHKS